MRGLQLLVQRLARKRLARDRDPPLSDDARLTYVGLTSLPLSVAYIGPKSRTERPMKTKIGTEVAHVTRDSDTTFNVKGQSQLAHG